MLHSKDCAHKCNPSDGAASNEDGLEGEGSDVADERDVWVDLTGVSGPANGYPPDEQDTERREPGDACHQREYPKFVRVAEIRKDFGPRTGHVRWGLRQALDQLVERRIN